MLPSMGTIQIIAKQSLSPMSNGGNPNGHSSYSRLQFQMPQSKDLAWLTSLRRMWNGNLIGRGSNNPLDGADDGIDVFFVGLPVADADAHGALAWNVVPVKNAVPSAQMAASIATRVILSAVGRRVPSPRTPLPYLPRFNLEVAGVARAQALFHRLRRNYQKTAHLSDVKQVR